MKVLMLSLDRGLCQKDSSVYRRLLNYAREIELRVIVFTLNSNEQEIHDGNLHVYPTNSRSRLFYFLDYWRIASRFLGDNQGCQFIITAQDPFEVGLVAWSLAWYYHRPWQVQVHIDFFSPYFQRESWRQWGQAKVAKLIIPRADAVRVVSRHLYNYLTESLKLSPLRVRELPVFTDVSHYLTAPVTTDLHRKYPEYQQIILLAARFVPQKNIPLAIRSFSRVRESFPQAGLVIVGRGQEEKRLRDLAENIPSISFETWADDLASYYQTTDIFLLSSNYEGWGLTVVEAAASGAAIVMTDVGCAGEFLTPDCGLVVPVNDEIGLTAALKELLADSAKRQDLGSRARERAQTLSTQEENIEAVVAGWRAASLRSRSKLFSPEVFKFLATGTTSSLAAILTIFLAVDGFGLHPVPGSVMANIVSGTTGFLLNKHWTFGNKSARWRRQAMGYFGMVILNLFVSAGLMYVFFSLLGLWYLLSQVIIILMMMTVNFLINKFLIFKH